MEPDPNLLKDLPHLTAFSHTGSLEVFHALLNKYAPKRLHFSYPGMVMRTQLAVIDHNEHVGRQQATLKDGCTSKWETPYNKVTRQWFARPVKEPKQHDSFYEIADDVELAARARQQSSRPAMPKLPKNIAPVQKPEKSELIARQRSRFTSKSAPSSSAK